LAAGARLLAPGAAIAAALTFAAVLWTAARGVNRPPVVTAVIVNPRIVAAGSTAMVRVIADDPDGDRLQFAFEASAGQIEVPDGARPNEARYTAAAAPSPAPRIVVKITDRRDLTTTASVVLMMASGVPTPTPTPEPEVEAAPAPPSPTATALPSGPAPTAPPASTPTPHPAIKSSNQAPNLDGGVFIGEVEDSVVGLEATGWDPDGDPITFAWDFGPCATAEQHEQKRADIHLRPECNAATVMLTWTDSHGASVSTVWTITR
jgi:hypothetical protein